MSMNAILPAATTTQLPRVPMQRRLLALAVASLLALAIGVAVATDAKPRLIALVFIAAAIGMTLQRARFGFSGAFRAAAARRDFDGLRMHALLIGLTSLFFLPLLTVGSLFGQPLWGFGTGLGPSMLIGALMFGIGMQLAGGCASGTLFALGNGNLKHIGTGAGFILGSTLAAFQIGFWRDLPQTRALFVQDEFGLPLGLFLQTGGLALAFAWLTRRAIGPLWQGWDLRGPLRGALFAAPWPLLVGALCLAGLNVTTLVVSGQPWGETSAFALWGSKLVEAAGLGDAHGWTYWAGNAAGLERSIFSDIATIMDLSIVLGALVSAAASREFNLRTSPNFWVWVAALIGGTLMGYGARIAGGCNIGAYFSAGASGSLSAWLWMLMALIGSAISLALRDRIGLDRIEAKLAAGC